MIDVSFDFTSDTPGYWDGYWERMNGLGGCGKKDPDSCSPTLLGYSRRLWSRVLPNVERMELEIPRHRGYLVWNAMRLSCDSITCSFRYARNEKMIREVYASMDDYKSWIENFTRRSYTLPGEMIFPMHVKSMNQQRGMNRKIRDRWDLTLECIRRYYAGEDSPLADVLNSDRDFFDMFVDFRSYIDFFFLNDCVTDDYSRVNIWTEWHGFSTDALPASVPEYFGFMNRQGRFLENRRRRMQDFIDLNHM